MLHVYIIILTILCRLKIIECRKAQIYDIGFINPNIIHEWMVQKNVKETEDNFLQSLLKNQNKEKILFPYNFRVLLSCAYSVSLITRGYSNVIDELCMRAQLPPYSPRD